MAPLSTYLGPAGLLSDTARDYASRAGGTGSFWGAITGLFADKKNQAVTVKQVKFRRGWDRLDYRADGCDPFCFIGDHTVYMRFTDTLVEFLLLVDDIPVDATSDDGFPAEGTKGLPPEGALLVRCYVAATRDDYVVSPEEEQALLALRRALRADEATMRQVQHRVVERVAWLMMDDFHVAPEEHTFIDRLAAYFHIAPPDKATATLRAVTARAAVLALAPNLDRPAIQKWEAMARAEGLPAERVASTVQSLERAYFAACCRHGRLPVVHSTTAPLRPGEDLHFASRAAIFRARTGPERLVVRTSGPSSDPVISMLLEAEPLPPGDRNAFERVDAGSFYLTSQRLLVVGRARTFSCAYPSIAAAERYGDGIRIDARGPAGYRYYQIKNPDEAFAILQALRQSHDRPSDDGDGVTILS